METYEVIGLMLRGRNKEVAAELGLSVSTVDKWGEAPNGSGHDIPSRYIGPVSRLLNNLSLISHLADWCGAVVYRPDAVPCRATIPNISTLCREFAETVETVSGAIKDGKITPIEAKRVRKEGMELIRATMQTIDCIERQVAR